MQNNQKDAGNGSESVSIDSIKLREINQNSNGIEDGIYEQQPK